METGASRVFRTRTPTSGAGGMRSSSLRHIPRAPAGQPGRKGAQIQDSSSVHQRKTASGIHANRGRRRCWKYVETLRLSLQETWQFPSGSQALYCGEVAAQAFERRPRLTGSMRNGCTSKREEESRWHFVAGNAFAAGESCRIEHFGFAIRPTHRASAHGSQSNLHVEGLFRGDHHG